jgi:hypothetical protein
MRSFPKTCGLLLLRKVALRAFSVPSMTPMVIEARNLTARGMSGILQRNKTAANP